MSFCIDAADPAEPDVFAENKVCRAETSSAFFALVAASAEAPASDTGVVVSVDAADFAASSTLENVAALAALVAPASAVDAGAVAAAARATGSSETI